MYLISFVGFGLIPIAVAVLVVDEQRRASVEHQLLVGQVLQVQVPDAIEITQASLQPVFRQILTCLRWTKGENGSPVNRPSFSIQSL